jgi:ABC transporter family protein
LEAEIETLENQSKAISEQMLETNDAEKLMELQAELDKISHRQEAAMLEWEELSEQV